MKQPENGYGEVAKCPAMQDIEHLLGYPDRCPEYFHYSKLDWQIFGGLSYGNNEPGISQVNRDVRTLMKVLAREIGVSFRGEFIALWVIEVGPTSGRKHVHFSIGGLPESKNQKWLCDFASRAWKGITEGYSKIEPYDASEDGIGYICKHHKGNWFSDMPPSAGHRSDSDTHPTPSDALRKLVRRMNQ